MRKERVGFALTGSFCTLQTTLEAMETLAEEYPNLIPIVSPAVAGTDTRFGRAEDFQERIVDLCGHGILNSIRDAEPIGPKKLLDVLVIAPCTGNTLAKLAAGVADTAVTMAAKSHLRNGRPVVVAISTNDGLAGASRNIGELLCRKHYYFVPFRQDDFLEKPTSLVADFGKLTQTVTAALEGRQVQPLLLGPAG